MSQTQAEKMLVLDRILADSQRIIDEKITNGNEALKTALEKIPLDDHNIHFYDKEGKEIINKPFFLSNLLDKFNYQESNLVCEPSPDDVNLLEENIPKNAITICTRGKINGHNIPERIKKICAGGNLTIEQADTTVNLVSGGNIEIIDKYITVAFGHRPMNIRKGTIYGNVFANGDVTVSEIAKLHGTGTSEIVAAGNIKIKESNAKLYCGGNITPYKQDTLSNLQEDAYAKGNITAGRIANYGKTAPQIIAGGNIIVDDAYAKLISGGDIAITKEEGGFRHAALAKGSISLKTISDYQASENKNHFHKRGDSIVAPDLYSTNNRMPEGFTGKYHHIKLKHWARHAQNRDSHIESINQPPLAKENTTEQRPEFLLRHLANETKSEKGNNRF